MNLLNEEVFFKFKFNFKLHSRDENNTFTPCIIHLEIITSSFQLLTLSACSQLQLQELAPSACFRSQGQHKLLLLALANNASSCSQGQLQLLGLALAPSACFSSQCLLQVLVLVLGPSASSRSQCQLKIIVLAQAPIDSSS